MLNHTTLVEVELSRGKVAIISPEDAEAVLRHKWYFVPPYAGRTVRREDGGYTTQRLHRFILPAPAGMEVDHINRDPLDCRRDNLRIVTPRQNKQNYLRKKNRMGNPVSSEYSGVHWDSQSKKWSTEIFIDGKKYRLGLFEKEKDAALAHDSIVAYYRPEFGCISFPQEVKPVSIERYMESRKRDAV